MNKIIFLFCICNGLFFSVLSQDRFHLTFGNQNPFVSDIVYDIAKDHNDNIFMISSTVSFGDFSVIKYDSSGNFIWSIGLNPQGGQPYRIISLMDSTLLICGGMNNQNPNSSQDLTLIKIDTSGNVLWSKFFAQNLIVGPQRIAIKELINGDILLAYTNLFTDSTGINQYNSVIAKTSSFGDLIWAKKLDTQHNTTISGVFVKDMDNIFVIGTIDFAGFGNSDAMLLKIDSAGTFMIAKLFGSAYSERGYGIVSTINSGFILFCTENNNPLNYFSPYFIGIDDSMNVLWNKKHILATNYRINSVTELQDNNFILAGSSPMFMKVDQNGNILWRRNYGNTGFNLNGVKALESNSHQLFITGYMFSDIDIFLAKTDSIGDSGCNNQNLVIPIDTTPLLNDSIIVYNLTDTTLTEVINNDNQYTIGIVDSVWCTSTSLNDESTFNKSYNYFPNPTADVVTLNFESQHENQKLTIELFNPLGLKVYSCIKNPFDKTIKLELNFLSDGIYIMKIKEFNSNKTKGINKIIKSK